MRAGFALPSRTIPTPEKPLNLMAFPGVNFAAECCIWETAFPAESR